MFWLVRNSLLDGIRGFQGFSIAKGPQLACSHERYAVPTEIIRAIPKRQ